VLTLFFVILLDEPVYEFSSYRVTFTTYLLLQFLFVAVIRFAITTRTNIRIRKRLLGFPTLLIGSGRQALDIFTELDQMRKSLGYQFIGYLAIPGAQHHLLEDKLPYLGNIHQLEQVVADRQVEEIIIALEKNESERIGEVIDYAERSPANIKVVPGIYDYIVGSVKISHILGAPLIEVFPQIMKTWERVLKRIIDIVISIIALIILSPVYLVLAILIKLDSEGPVLFKQERIGKNGVPFYIYKFRSMYTDAEKMGPALSSDADPRITRIGQVLRKLRLDELPQFWNVLRGDMSIVGPRPERQFYIDQIVKVAPHYRHLHKVRPGITSWGQVKYGYASNVEEMVERLKFDILYIEHMSLMLDLKILLYTLIVIIEGRGK
jgi:exopolysaccharide biosynthesis polyprenyl glycosylphosphotransferase